MKKRYHRKMKGAILAAMVALALSGGTVYGSDMPENGTLFAGDVTIDSENYKGYGGNTSTIAINPFAGNSGNFQVNANSVIHWGSFNLGTGKTLNFSGTQSGLFLLNRVTGETGASLLKGAMNVTGSNALHVILANKNGITIGEGASFSGNDILLSAADIHCSGYNPKEGSANTIVVTGTPGNITASGSFSVGGKLTLVGRTISVDDNITFTGNAALNLLAGTPTMKQNTLTGVGNDGTITFNGDVSSNTQNVTLTAEADTVSMAEDKRLLLTGDGSKVNIINAKNLQNINISAEEAVNITYPGNYNFSMTGSTLSADEVNVATGSSTTTGTDGKLTAVTAKEDIRTTTIEDSVLTGDTVNIVGSHAILNNSKIDATDKANIISGSTAVPVTGAFSDGRSLSIENGTEISGADVNIFGSNVTLTGTGTKVTAGEAGNVRVLAGTGRSGNTLTAGTANSITFSDGATIEGKDVLLAGGTMTIGDGEVNLTEGNAYMLTGSSIDTANRQVVTAAAANKIDVTGTITAAGGDAVFAGGAVNVNGGTVNTGTNSAYLLAGKTINAANAAGDSGDVITAATNGNKVTISESPAIKARNLHVAGYEAALKNSTVEATNPVNAVTGSAIQKADGILERKQIDGATRGNLSRDDSSSVSDNSAFVELPTKGSVVQGSIDYNDSLFGAGYLNPQNNSTIAVHEAEEVNHSVINWQTFDIGINGILNFDTAHGALLNRVVGKYDSWLKGTLSHTGSYPLLLVNPNGIHVYEGATINASNLLLSGLSMTDDAFNTFAGGGDSAAFDTSSPGEVEVDSGVNFTSNNSNKLALIGKKVNVEENTIDAGELGELMVDATESATLNSLTYTGALKGNSYLDTDGGSLSISKGSYTGNVTAQGTTVNVTDGTYAGDLSLAGTNVNVSGATFDGENKTHDLTLSGLGANGSVTVSNSTVTGAKDVTLTGKTVNVSQSGSNPVAWTAETLTLGNGESASNSTTITNVNVTVTTENGPSVNNDVALTLNNSDINAPKINIDPASLTLKGGSTVQASTGGISVNSTSNVTLQESSSMEAATGGITVTANEAAKIEGGSTVTATAGNIGVNANVVNVGTAANDTSKIEAVAGSINLTAGLGEAVKTEVNKVDIKGATITANASEKNVEIIGYDISNLGTINTNILNLTGQNASTTGIVTAKALNVDVDGTSGNATVGGTVNIDTGLNLSAGNEITLSGTINAPTLTVSAQKVTASNAVLTASGKNNDTGNSIDITATDTASITNTTLQTASESNNGDIAVKANTISGNGSTIETKGNILLASGGETESVYTTTEGGKIDMAGTTFTGEKLTAVARNTSIKNSTINANTIEAAATDSIESADWSATFGTENALDLSGNTVRNKAGESAIDSVKLAGKNVTFGGGSTDAAAFKAASVAVSADNAITVSSGIVDITGAGGLSISGKSITVDGTINARQINLTATENNAILNSNSVLNATGENETNAIGITATSGDINANGRLTADDSITMNAGKDIAANATIVANNVNLMAGNDIGTAGSIAAKSVSLTAGNDVNSAADVTASTITMDSGDGKSVSATGAMIATGGTVTLGHAPSDAPAKAGTKTVTIGPASGANKMVQAQTVNVNATDSIGLSRVTMETTSNLNLASKEVSVSNSTVTTEGIFSLEGTEDGENPSVSITGSTLEGTAVNTTGKGISVGNATLTAAAGGIAVNSTGENDVALTSSGLNAANGAVGVSATGNITSSSDMTAKTGVQLRTTTGTVSSSGSLTATSGDIIMDSADGSKISVTGNLVAENGTVTLGHASGASATGTVAIGPATDSKTVEADTLNIHATDKIDVKNTSIDVVEDMSLISKMVALDHDIITTQGSLAINGTEEGANPSVAIVGSTLQGTSLTVDGKGINVDGSSLTATTDGIAVNSTGENVISLYTSDLNATMENAGNITVDSAKAIEIDNTLMNAGNDIAITAAAATDASYNMAINASAGGYLTAGNNIALTTATGQLRYAGTLNAGNDINLKAVAEDIEVSGSVSAGNDVIFEGKNRVSSTANITTETGDAKLISSEGNLSASGNLNVGRDVNYRAATGASVNANITATSGEVGISTTTGGVTFYGTMLTKDIGITAGTGAVNSGGSLTATDGNILLDSADGSKVTAAGDMIAEDGNITLGHSDGEEANKTGTVEIGNPSYFRASLSAQNLSVNATDALNVKNVNATITGDNGIALSSDVLNITNAKLEADYGDIDISFNGYNPVISNYNFHGTQLIANDNTEGKGKIRIASPQVIKAYNSTITANGDVNFDASEGGYIYTDYNGITSNKGNINFQAGSVDTNNIGIQTRDKLIAYEGNIDLEAATGNISILGDSYHNAEAENIKETLIKSPQQAT